MNGRRYHEVNRPQPTWAEELRQFAFLMLIGFAFIAVLLLMGIEGIR